MRGQQTVRGCTTCRETACPRRAAAAGGGEQIEGSVGGMGDRIGNGAGLDEKEGPGVGMSDGLELAEESGVGTVDGI